MKREGGRLDGLGTAIRKPPRETRALPRYEISAASSMFTHVEYTMEIDYLYIDFDELIGTYNMILFCTIRDYCWRRLVSNVKIEKTVRVACG